MQDTRKAAGPEPRHGVTVSQARGTLAVSALATFMVFLDVTVVSVALPSISENLGSTTGIQWVVSAYLLALGVAQPVTGWMAARFGPKQSLLVTLGLFAATSVTAGLAPSLPLLIGARALQGMAGGLIVPLATTILFAAFPPERRGRAIGVSGMVVMAAPALGPVISGYVLSFASWRWLMLLNAPVGLLGIAVGARFIPDSGVRERRPFDLVGLLLVGSGLVLLLYGFSRTEHDGWASPGFIAMVGASAVVLVAYVLRTLRIDQPLIDLRIFRHRAFSTSVAIAWALSLAQFGRIVLIPVELQVVRGFSALQAGFVLAFSGLASGVSMPFAGRWADRSGGRGPAVTGTVLVGLATVRLATLGVATPLWQLLVALALMGFGIVLVTMPVTVVALNAVPEGLVPEAASVRSLNREVAGAVSTSVLAAIVAARAGSISTTAANDAATLARHQSAFNAAFLVALAALVVCLLLASTLPSRPQHRAEPPAEDRAGDGGDRGEDETGAPLRPPAADAVRSEASTGDPAPDP